MKSIIFKTILIIMMIIGLVLMCSCGNGKSTVGEALGTLLNCNNYKSEWSIKIEQPNEDESDYISTSITFHNPYKFKGVGVFDQPDELGVISATEYEIEKGSDFEQKNIYIYENGNTGGPPELATKTNEENLITQLKNCLLSEEYIGEQTVDGAKVKEYKIDVTAYPFVYYLGVPNDKNDIRTKTLMDEYKTCEGYVYINSKTKYIQKIEFDLSDKMALNKEIVEKVTNGIDYPNFTMSYFSEFVITIDISDINDNSKEIEDTKKEIDGIMN